MSKSYKSGDIVHTYPDGWTSVYGGFDLYDLRDTNNKLRGSTLKPFQKNRITWNIKSPYARARNLAWLCLFMGVAAIGGIITVFIMAPAEFQLWPWVFIFAGCVTVLIESMWLGVNKAASLEDLKKGVAMVTVAGDFNNYLYNASDQVLTVTMSNTTRPIQYKPAAPLKAGTWTFNTTTTKFYISPGSITIDSIRITLPDPPEIEEEEFPVLAQRYAGLYILDGELKFMSVAVGGLVTWGVEADAVCNKHLSYGISQILHEVPNWECGCGFYGVPADMLPSHMHDYNGQSRLTLEVEFSGNIIIHEQGYRAEHQRVLKVLVPDCWCGKQSNTLWFRRKGLTLEAIDCGEHLYTSAIPNIRNTTWQSGAAIPGSWNVSYQSRYDVTPKEYNFVSMPIERASEMLGVPFEHSPRRK